jgi:hypothetical protein
MSLSALQHEVDHGQTLIGPVEVVVAKVPTIEAVRTGIGEMTTDPECDDGNATTNAEELIEVGRHLIGTAR